MDEERPKLRPELSERSDAK